MQDFYAALLQAKQKLPFSIPAVQYLSSLNPASRHPKADRRRKGLAKSKYFGGDNVAALQTSFSIVRSIRQLRRHKFQWLDIQYAVLGFLTIFSLWIIDASAPLIKTGVFLGYMLLLLMPATRQFFLPSWPIWVYLLYFFSSRYIPFEVRPHIWVEVLPALENVLYGANLSNILSAHTHPVLDVLAWIPYGLGHFGLPAICSAAMFLFAAPGTVPSFARAFGWMSILGVTIQLVFPCSAPWYENMYGLMPAEYGMQGSPAGLARIDALLGFDMYTTGFTTAPVPFGAFPSLHAADATLEALFIDHCFPFLRPLCIFYVVWIWWATMYLGHHYAVDLVAGSLIASVIFYLVRTRWLPRRQADKRNRWEYDFVEVGELRKAADEEDGYAFGLLERRGTMDSDEWSLGSSSGFSSHDGSNSSGSGSGTSSGSSGLQSPVVPNHDGSPRGEPMFAGMTANGTFWDGQRLARDSELAEVVVMRP